MGAGDTTILQILRGNWRGERVGGGFRPGTRNREETPAISFSSGEVDSGRKMGAGGMNLVAVGAALFLFGVSLKRRV